MSTRFCQDCGAAAESAAAFCASCGTRLAAPPALAGPAAVARGSGRASSRSRFVSLLAIAAVTALVAVPAAVILLDRLSPGASPGASPGEVRPAPTVALADSAPSDASSAAPPTAAPTTEPVVTSPPDIAVGETPVEAVAAFLQARGARFAGTCATADQIADVGAYCAELYDDRGALQVHWVGLVGSEPDTWLLVAAAQTGWAVIDFAPIDDPTAGPPF
jgi:hypothetical protein